MEEIYSSQLNKKVLHYNYYLMLGCSKGKSGHCPFPPSYGSIPNFITYFKKNSILIKRIAVAMSQHSSKYST
jgi:hypothetical protein